MERNGSQLLLQKPYFLAQQIFKEQAFENNVVVQMKDHT
jgi:hypothetical protein